MTPRRSVARVASGAATVAALSFVLLVLQPASDRVATNTEVVASRNQIALEAGERHCQGGEFIPKSARVVRFALSAGDDFLSPEMELAFGPRSAPQRYRILVDRQPVGPVLVPLPPHPTLEMAQFCLRNAGGIPMALDGNLTPLPPEGAVGIQYRGKRPVDEIRLDYYSGKSETWLEYSGTLAAHWSLFKPWGMAGWWLWLLLAAAVGASSLALVTYVRSVPE